MTLVPTVVASRDGKRAIEVFDFDGADGIPDHAATGHYFSVRLEPDGLRSRLVVVFSDSVYDLRSGVRSGVLGLPELRDKQETFNQAALAAIGDFLDAGEEITFTPSGVSAFQIECFSGDFQSWKDRDPASDDEIEAYLRARVYWAWMFNRPGVLITVPDTLRLARPIERIDKLVKLHEGSDWTVTTRKEGRKISMAATPEFLLAVRRDGLPPGPSDTTDLAVTGGEVESSGHDEPSVFVSDVRISGLKKIQPEDFDLSRLIVLCEELNACYGSQCYHAVAALTRTVMNHVPPVFGYTTFSEVANNHGGGGKSFKEMMEHLENGARKVGDSHLHQRIRRTESLPTGIQVDFRPHVDMLLGEIVRLLADAEGENES